MKSFFYIANLRLPTEKAHGVQIINTAVALARTCRENGTRFELLFADRKNSITENIFTYYGIRQEDRFPIHQIKTIRILRPRKLFFWLQRLQFIIKMHWYLWGNADKQSVLYSRDEFLLASFSKKRNMFWESHEGKDHCVARMVLRKIRGLVVISFGLSKKYQSYISQEKILVAPDAVNLEKFGHSFSREEIEQCRKENLIQIGEKVITYIGSVGLYDWKGVDVFLGAAAFLPEYRFLLVGGNAHAIQTLRTQYPAPNILYVGQKKSDEIPLFQKISDVLVLPNKSGNEVSEKYTSPMKLFEYMASGVPIVASRLPSICEILSDTNATFFRANDISDLVIKIRSVFSEQNESFTKADQAKTDVLKYTYEKRADAIVSFLAIKHIRDVQQKLWVSGLQKTVRNIVSIGMSFFPLRLQQGASILMYHSVGVNGIFFTVTPSQFERQVAYLKEKGYSIIFLSELIQRIRKKESVAGCVCLTFDDGYVDNYTQVFPIIQKYRVPITIFLITDRIGGAMEFENGTSLPLMSHAQIQEMIRSGLCECMPHTATHQTLTEIAPEKVIEEIHTSQKEIEKLYDVRVSDQVFAFPKGKYNTAVLQMIQETQCAAAVTVRGGLVSLESNRYLLERNSVDSETTHTQFKIKVSDMIQWYIKIKNFFR